MQTFHLCCIKGGKKDTSSMPSTSSPPSPGLYRPHFTPAERRALDTLLEQGITSEIDLIRVVLARNFASPAANPPDLPSRLQALRARARAVRLIASLLRTQVFTLDARGDLNRLIQEALAAVDPYLYDDDAKPVTPSKPASSDFKETIP